MSTKRTLQGRRECGDVGLCPGLNGTKELLSLDGMLKEGEVRFLGWWIVSSRTPFARVIEANDATNNFVITTKGRSNYSIVVHTRLEPFLKKDVV